MLTIPLDRVMELLDKAADVEVPALPISEDESRTVTVVNIEALDELLAEDPAYQALLDAVEELSPRELRELLALDLMARNDAGAEQWQPMIEQANAVPEDDTIDMLISILLLTDHIEQALESLGYIDEEEYELADEEDGEEEEGEEEEGEEEEGEDDELAEDEEGASGEKNAEEGRSAGRTRKKTAD
jgi:hypothetical protein